MSKRAGLISAVALVFTVACGETDAGITTEVKANLAADETVSAFEIDVDTQEGIVTLTGEVESAAARQQAVQIARSTEGVTDVIDNLRIEGAAATSGFGGVTDAAREGAQDIGDAAREGAQDAAEGAKRIGSEVEDAVTDDDNR